MFRTVQSVGWRFQRRRRLHLYTKLENRDGQQLPTMMHQTTVAAGPSQQQQQLEQSLRGLLQFQTNQKSPGGASSEQITELTQSVNKFLENMEAGQKNKSDKES
jgi:parvulin-like peptidyl-prolyl isomerase